MVEDSQAVPKVGSQNEELKIVVAEIPNEKQKPRAVPKFVPPDCCICKQLREEKGESRSFARVYATLQHARYIKCYFCGHTWRMDRT